MNDDELDEFLYAAFSDYWWEVLNPKISWKLKSPDIAKLFQTEKDRYITIAKHLMEFTDKEMKNETTN